MNRPEIEIRDALHRRTYPYQDRVVLSPRAPVRAGPARPARSVLASVLISVPLIGYFLWYYRATRDCEELLGEDLNPWQWLVMLFPGLVLLFPYGYAQAKLVARVELAAAEPLRAIAFVALCVGGFLLPALLPLVLQPRLNRALAADSMELRRARAVMLRAD